MKEDIVVLIAKELTLCVLKNKPFTAPIRSEVDDISLFIINFEDLSEGLLPSDELEPTKLSKCK